MEPTQTLEVKAKELAWLLAQSVMPQEQKEAWLNLLPLMTDEQVDQLVQVLKSEQASYQQASKDFFQDLQNFEHNFSETIQELKAADLKLIDRFIETKLAEVKLNK